MGVGLGWGGTPSCPHNSSFFNTTQEVNVSEKNQNIMVPVNTELAGPSMNVSFPR
jgi:hypothetical protein